MSKIEIFAGNGIENAFISNGITADETYRFDGNQWRDGFFRCGLWTRPIWIS